MVLRLSRSNAGCGTWLNPGLKSCLVPPLIFSVEKLKFSVWYSLFGTFCKSEQKTNVHLVYVLMIHKWGYELWGMVVHIRVEFKIICHWVERWNHYLAFPPNFRRNLKMCFRANIFCIGPGCMSEEKIPLGASDKFRRKWSFQIFQLTLFPLTLIGNPFKRLLEDVCIYN